MADLANWHALVPQQLFADVKAVTPSGILVYAALSLYANRRTGLCCPSTATLVRTTGLSRSTVQAKTALLVRLGYIEKKTLGKTQLNAYRILSTPAQPLGPLMGGTRPTIGRGGPTIGHVTRLNPPNHWAHNSRTVRINKDRKLKNSIDLGISAPKKTPRQLMEEGRSSTTKPPEKT